MTDPTPDPVQAHRAEAMALLERVFAEGRRRRGERVGVALTTLTRYERRLVREAAVMGYVLGRQDGQLRVEPFPKDSTILHDVIEHCDTLAHLYPYLAAACDGRRRRVTRARLWPGEDTTR